MSKLKPEEKSTVMSRIASEYAVIKAAQDQVHALEVAVAPDVKAIVDAFGPGPHKLPMPDGDRIVNFRKDGDTWTFTTKRLDEIT